MLFDREGSGSLGNRWCFFCDRESFLLESFYLNRAVSLWDLVTWTPSCSMEPARNPACRPQIVSATLDEYAPSNSTRMASAHLLVWICIRCFLTSKTYDPQKNGGLIDDLPWQTSNKKSLTLNKSKICHFSRERWLLICSSPSTSHVSDHLQT